MVKKSSKNCSQCGGETEKVKKSDLDKLLRASLDTPPLTMKELKAKLKRERERKSGYR
jgi:hypothetical protein